MINNFDTLEGYQELWAVLPRTVLTRQRQPLHSFDADLRDENGRDLEGSISLLIHGTLTDFSHHLTSRADIPYFWDDRVGVTSRRAFL